MNPKNYDAAQRLTIRLREARADMTADEYHVISDFFMVALLDLEEANPEHFADPGIASQAGPTSDDRFIEIEAVIRIDPDYVWTQIPNLPGCFETGATFDQAQVKLREELKMLSFAGCPEIKAMMADAVERANLPPTSVDDRDAILSRLRNPTSTETKRGRT